MPDSAGSCLKSPPQDRVVKPDRVENLDLVARSALEFSNVLGSPSYDLI